MRYSWDEKKNRRNLKLHGIAFEEAVKIFDGPSLEVVDDRFDYGEERIYAIGLARGVEITVIYADEESTKRDKTAKDIQRRIISAWRSEPHECRRYWQSLED